MTYFDHDVQPPLCNCNRLPVKCFVVFPILSHAFYSLSHHVSPCFSYFLIYIVLEHASHIYPPLWKINRKQALWGLLLCSSAISNLPCPILWGAFKSTCPLLAVPPLSQDIPIQPITTITIIRCRIACQWEGKHHCVFWWVIISLWLTTFFVVYYNGLTPLFILCTCDFIYPHHVLFPYSPTHTHITSLFPPSCTEYLLSYCPPHPPALG